MLSPGLNVRSSLFQHWGQAIELNLRHQVPVSLARWLTGGTALVRVKDFRRSGNTFLWSHRNAMLCEVVNPLRDPALAPPASHAIPVVRLSLGRSSGKQKNPPGWEGSCLLLL